MTGHVNLRVGKIPPRIEHQRNFDLFEPAGGHKIGFLTGVVYDNEFRVLMVSVERAGRSLSPSEWKSVVHGLRDHLPETVSEITGNRLGEGCGLDGIGEKQVTLRQTIAPDIDLDR